MDIVVYVKGFFPKRCGPNLKSLKIHSRTGLKNITWDILTIYQQVNGRMPSQENITPE
jgi:hypothetical protein